jgi:hypothetical protein
MPTGFRTIMEAAVISSADHPRIAWTRAVRTPPQSTSKR